MGKRDYRHRESKKPKKRVEKLAPISALPTSASVEVVRREKKKREDEEAEG